MSDCGIHGNKNWQRAVDKASDKPAATVTGSGDRCTSVFSGPTHYRCELPAGHEHAHSSRCDNAQFVQVWPNVPTPASPTVTLDRETFDGLCNELEMEACAAEISFNYPAAARLTDLLALLRAAERQQ